MINDLTNALTVSATLEEVINFPIVEMDRWKLKEDSGCPRQEVAEHCEAKQF